MRLQRLAIALALVGTQAGADPRADLLARGEAALRSGESAAALEDFERAAAMRHEADAELGLIRAAMQDGQYRRALAFAAHTAGEHPDHPEAAALYGWLLHVGGQTALARRLQPELVRFGPLPLGPASPPADARPLGTAVLVGPQEAIVPRHEAGRVWLRDGLGRTVAAEADHPGDPVLAAQGLVLLRLQSPLDGPAAPTAAREPFAGSPGFALQYGAATAQADWPLLTTGFLGAQAGPLRRLGFADAAPGAAVLDRQGRLAGIVVVGGTADAPLWFPLARWRPAAAGDMIAGPAALPAPDLAYEAGLRVTLQVLAAPPK